MCENNQEFLENRFQTPGSEKETAKCCQINKHMNQLRVSVQTGFKAKVEWIFTQADNTAAFPRGFISSGLVDVFFRAYICFKV